jgi:hypothetical protein
VRWLIQGHGEREHRTVHIIERKPGDPSDCNFSEHLYSLYFGKVSLTPKTDVPQAPTDDQDNVSEAVMSLQQVSSLTVFLRNPRS